jgi:type VI secretion system protein ImpJ
MKPYWPPSRQLLPVHLQASDSYAEQLLQLRVDSLQALVPGVLEMRADDAAWQRGLLAFKSLSAILPSGVPFVSRDGLSRDGMSLPVGATSVFLAVPRAVLRGPNVAVPDAVSPAVRYVALGTPAIPWLAPQARLVTRAELTADLESVRLGRVERSGTRLQWQAGSIPTVARVGASNTLRAGLERLVVAIGERKQDLLRFRKEHPLRFRDVAADELPGLHLLTILQRYLPMLADDAARANVAPRTLYAHLTGLHGALSAFVDADQTVPPYVHESLADSLPWLFREIAKLVDEAARDRTTTLPFVRQDATTFRLTFERQALVGKRPFLVASGADEAFLRDRVPSLLKMASVQAMPRLLQSALRGVAVAVEFEPASAIPRRPDVVTYRINTRDELWLDIEDRRSIVLSLPNAPPQIQFVLYGVERTA